MDGYAVRSENMAGPWRVIGESAAGHPFGGAVGPGEAVRISTGAVMPQGADAVILQEDVARDGDTHRPHRRSPCPARQAHPPPGHGLSRGRRAAARRHPDRPGAGRARHFGRARAISRSAACRALRSSTAATNWPELRQLRPHQMPASNGAMLAALAASVPCQAERLGPVADTMDAIAQVLARAEQADLIVTSGGASVGDHDLIRPALEAWGAEIDFWRIAIKPGKPLLVARRAQRAGTSWCSACPAIRYRAMSPPICSCCRCCAPCWARRAAAPPVPRRARRAAGPGRIAPRVPPRQLGRLGDRRAKPAGQRRAVLARQQQCADRPRRRAPPDRPPARWFAVICSKMAGSLDAVRIVA